MRVWLVIFSVEVGVAGSGDLPACAKDNGVDRTPLPAIMLQAKTDDGYGGSFRTLSGEIISLIVEVGVSGALTSGLSGESSRRKKYTAGSTKRRSGARHTTSRPMHHTGTWNTSFESVNTAGEPGWSGRGRP